MFCSNCGNKLADESKFCPKCGNKSGEVSEEKQTPAPNNDAPKKTDEENGPVQNAQSETSPESAVRTSEENVIVYKDKFMLFITPIIIAIAPFFTIYAIVQDGSFDSAPVSIFLCIIFMIASIHYYKYIRGGIIIDLNKRIISLPKFVLFRPYPRIDISFNDITSIQATDDIQFERNAYGNLKTDLGGNLVTLKTYNFIIHGTFGTKKIAFRNREKRDQFYSLLKTYGNFS